MLREERPLLVPQRLGYRYLGNWEERPGNANIEPDLLRAWLMKRGVDASLITSAIQKLQNEAGDPTKGLDDRNRAAYGLLRYGIPLKPGAGELTETVRLIDWANPEANDFALAEEVTVAAPSAKAHEKRPDLVLYVNGIALGVLELKRSTVNVSKGIHQNLDNQKAGFIEPFFSTVQLLMAGNDTQGVRYAAIDTKEKYWLAWKEPSPIENPLDRDLTQLCHKRRFLEIIHDFIVYDAGRKKLCRHNQYFGVRAAVARMTGAGIR